ncbi:MAG: hypothetical protein CVV04_13845 [Firmicutes bacterium HGW-Firmicutes-9]|jgi:hypothetical protein|nr:MAG: hypothetical protein CVV04_13845 [Firmicutes bacterium HGW-Firmicutes-9]
MTYLECKSFFDYYLSLEKDFLQTETYVAFHSNNYEVFSIEFSKQFLSISCEVETVLKKICLELNSEKSYEKITQYRDCVVEHLKYFSSESVYFIKPHVILQPWLSWSESKPLDWWQDYTKVKHRRADTDEAGNPIFFRANLRNLLNALAALYIAEEYLFYLVEKKYGQYSNNKSYALQHLKSDALIMKDWSKCYLNFQGDYWCDIGRLDKIMVDRSEQ